MNLEFTTKKCEIQIALKIPVYPQNANSKIPLERNLFLEHATLLSIILSPRKSNKS